MTATSTKNHDLVPAIARGVAVLEALAAAEGRPVAVSELSRQLGLPKSSTANLCASLAATGLAWRAEGGYTLGRKLAELGGRYLSTTDQVREFYELCRAAPTLSQTTARVAVLESLDVLYLGRYDGGPTIRLTANVGDRFPANCTATGKAILAAMDPAVVQDRLRGRALPRLTENSIGSARELLFELDHIRELGYAVDDQETTPGVTCFAVTVPSATNGQPPFAISATCLTSTLDQGRQQALLRDLHAVAEGMSSHRRRS